VVAARAPAGFAGVSAAQLDAALPEFRGQIEQIPPMHSALKRDGRPLYEYARRGIELERPARQVSIHELTVLDCQPMQARVRVHCSKGTYIRTLAQDIGRRLGCGAHLSALRRTRVGPFDVAQAVTLEALQTMPNPQSALISMDDLPAPNSFCSSPQVKDSV
jgi:tRNA pseudouridine55 synthase